MTAACVFCELFITRMAGSERKKADTRNINDNAISKIDQDVQSRGILQNAESLYAVFRKPASPNPWSYEPSDTRTYLYS